MVQKIEVMMLSLVAELLQATKDNRLDWLTGAPICRLSPAVTVQLQHYNDGVCVTLSDEDER